MSDVQFINLGNAKTPAQTETFGAAETVKSFTVASPVEKNSRISRAFVTIPDWTNTVTLVLKITDADGNTLYESSALAQDTTHDLTEIDAIIDGEITITLTLSGVPGAGGGDVAVSLYSSDSVFNSSVSVDNVNIVSSAYPAQPIVKSGPQAVVNLPTNAANPVEVDCSGAAVRTLCFYSKVEFQWCMAADQSAANTAIGSDTTRAIYPSGYYEFSVSGGTDLFYARSNNASGLTDGLSYHFLEDA